MVNRILLSVTAIGLLIAAPAAAQSRSGTGLGMSVDVGPQWAFPADDPELKGATGLRASWRRWFGPHLGISADLGWWRKRVDSTFRSPGSDVPGGTVPSIEGAARHSLSAYALGLGVLGRIPAGRAAVILGGGPGWFHDRGAYESRVSYDLGAREEQYSGHAGRNSFGVHMLAELEVRATGHMSVFGGMRSEVRDVRYWESGIVYPSAGIRFAF